MKTILTSRIVATVIPGCFLLMLLLGASLNGPGDEDSGGGCASAGPKMKRNSALYGAQTTTPAVERKTHDEDFVAFQEKAATWRALAAKPPLPQEVHRYQVLAADAVQEKRFEDAVNYYEQGLAIYPLWPDAQHDVALIDSELGNYGDAAFHMRCYVELVPNAPDAQAAGDQLIIWDEKAKKPRLTNADGTLRQGVVYTVQEGDTVKTIMDKLPRMRGKKGLPIKQILDANPGLTLDDLRNLKVGQKIFIPTSSGELDNKK